MTILPSLSERFENSIRTNWEHLALTNMEGVSLQYKDVARKVAKLHILYRECGIKPGDRIALAAAIQRNGVWHLYQPLLMVP